MKDFGECFGLATGNTPYRYQRRLAELPAWPDALEVPTGAGKTAAVVLAWLWRRRFASAEVRDRTARRLVLCLPMRSLTTQTATAAEGWLHRLGLATDVAVHVVMGGAVDDAWLATPDRDAVIVGTQDLLLSRALNRGFAMSRYEWPMAFGLLHSDVQWVFDEVQLMGVGATTSAQLDGLRRALGAYGPHHSLWMSATLESGRLATVDRDAGLDVMRLHDDEKAELEHLLTAAKPITCLNLDGNDLGAMAAAVRRAHFPGSRTLVVVNQVKRAQMLYQQLVRSERAEPVALLHSRFRPADRTAIERAVLRREWTGILVATQTVEAGVDISARTLITDLAPWPSLVQRFGRCNRFAEQQDARILWVDRTDEKATAPYALSELTVARDRLTTLLDGSPASLAALPPIAMGVTLPVIRRRDVIDLFDTSPDLAGADVDVSMYIRNGDETDVFVAWRDLAADAPPAPDAPLPTRGERCAVPIGAAREFLDLLRKRGVRPWRWDHRLEMWTPVERPVPGQVWLLPLSAGGYAPDLGFVQSELDSVPSVVVEAGVSGEGEGSDQRSFARSEETLADHSERVVDAAIEIARALPWLSSVLSDDLLQAARWHDAGKAHPVFQRTMYGVAVDGLRLLAKSVGRRRHERRGFRHEVASALLRLQAAPDAFRVAYLIAAHHGRARLIVRARPGEPAPASGNRYALGVWDGDCVPPAALGGGVTSPAAELRLGIFDLGGGGDGAGWTARAAALRDEVGPFRLACLEALLRAADWRGSAVGEVVP